jgi:hypothetical protein
MATLQTSRQTSAYTARARLKQIGPRQQPQPQAIVAPITSTTFAPISVEQVIAPVLPSALDSALAGAYRQRVSELDQHQMLLETVKIYTNWRLVSLQHRQENNTLVAHLLRSTDQGDPSTAITEGRTMQIIMDAVGDMKVIYSRQRRQNFLARWFARLLALFALKA